MIFKNIEEGPYGAGPTVPPALKRFALRLFLSDLTEKKRKRKLEDMKNNLLSAETLSVTYSAFKYYCYHSGFLVLLDFQGF